jgi:hypothetical protein
MNDSQPNPSEAPASTQASPATPAGVAEPARPMRLLNLDELRAVAGGPEVNNGGGGTG